MKTESNFVQWFLRDAITNIPIDRQTNILLITVLVSIAQTSYIPICYVDTSTSYNFITCIEVDDRKVCIPD